jgi:hypothetical protein
MQFKEGTGKQVIENAVQSVAAAGGNVTQHFTDSFLGFAASIPDDHLSILNTHEHVDVIEADGEVTTFSKSLGIQ